MTDYRENKDVRRPFASTPDPRVYFPASSIASARRDMTRCLARAEGFAVATGPAGVGKTLLARSLASEFEGVDLVAVVSASRRLNVKAFLQQLLFGLHQTFAGADETELRLMTFDYLAHSGCERFALIVDDAQNLTLRVFDEIRALVDHCAATMQTSVALVGAPSLEMRLNAPALFSFQQRVVSRSYLDNFAPGEVEQFIARELSRAAVDAAFTADAIRLVEKYSDRAPRVVVQLCDRALFLATEHAREHGESGALQIDERDVETAWRRLQNIAEREENASGEPEEVDDAEPADPRGVVEFGELEDEDEGDDAEENTPAATTTPAEPVESSDDEEEQDAADVAPRAPSEELQDELDEVLEDGAGEIDRELEARLLAKLNQTETTRESYDAKRPQNRETETPAMNYNYDYSATSPARRRREDDATYLSAPRVDALDSGSYDAALSFAPESSAEFVDNPPSVTRRPIRNGEDGAREFRELNGFNAEDSARFAADDRYLESQFQHAPQGSPLRNWGEPARDENASLEDRAYRQIVASCYRSVSDFPASEQYLNELRLLEQEIAEEANLIRRIRSIHLQLRAARDPLAQGQAK